MEQKLLLRKVVVFFRVLNVKSSDSSNPEKEIDAVQCYSNSFLTLHNE